MAKYGIMQVKLIIFDLDGVLVSTKNIHYQALNKALKEVGDDYVISVSDHLSKYDGLPTSKKLDILTKEQNLPIGLHKQIHENKQKYTFSFIRKEVTRNDRLIDVLRRIKELGIIIYVASNAISETVKLLLYYSGLIEYVDYYISNEDIKNPKPHSEIYLRCMARAGVNPRETLIVEDSPKGIIAAQNSMANILIVENPEKVTFDRIISHINTDNKQKLQLPDFNIVVPMAGYGSRFEAAGYSFPKPLIDIKGKTMIEIVVNNLGIDANYIYIVRKEHYDKYNLRSLLNLITPNCNIIQVYSVTEGAACTVLLASDFINNDKPLIVANSDQFMEWNPIEFYYKMIESNADGGIVTFTSNHPKWSYAKLDDNGNVVKVAEKDPISNHSTSGVYYFKEGSQFVKYANQMINKNIRTNNEFYLCPVFNEFIGEGKKIKTFDIRKMWGLGDPESLEYFINNYEG